MPQNQKRRVSERFIEEKLIEMLEAKKAVRSARSFSDAGVLTMNKGVVLTLQSGQKFQLTIVDAR